MARTLRHDAAARYVRNSVIMLTTLVAVTVWIGYSLRLVMVPSRSMSPTLLPGDIVTHRVDAYYWRMPRRGEVVVFRDRRNLELLIKCVIGQPGDEVAIVHGIVWVNGRRLYEPYVDGDVGIERPRRVKLGPDEVWVMGDNRDFSDDSRDYGPVEKWQLVGRAKPIIWPLDRRGPVTAVGATAKTPAPTR
jgi:signal peptidase I